MRILIVEDDEIIRQQLWRALLKEGYSVLTAKDGEEGLALALTHDLDVVVLDIMMPRRDGLSMCDALRRAKSSLPILMLTAKDDVADRVKGLDIGADDYLVKPFAYEELHARLKAMIRRDKVHRSSRIQIADLVIDTSNQVASRDGKRLLLTPREFTLLEALARNEGRVLTREAILERVWDNEESMPNTVNFHITSLRKKVDAPFERKLIHTVHGFGYTLRLDD